MNSVAITQLTERASIFYFPYFIYFAEDEQEELFHRDADTTLNYLTQLLCVFDKILIPSEQISLSGCEDSRRFKLEVLTHPWFQEMVRYGKIVTTIWGCCNDLDEHLEATNRYTSEIGAAAKRDVSLIASLPSLQIFRRDAAHQSQKAGGLFGYSQNIAGLDKLGYEDGPARIPFSHEKLLLTDFAQQFLWTQSMLEKAKRAYIQAMPIGNGTISRPLLGAKFEHANAPLGYDPEGSIAIHPGILVPTVLAELFQTKLGFPRLGEKHFNDADWRRKMMILIFDEKAIRFRRSIFSFFAEASKLANGVPPDLNAFMIPKSFLGDLDHLKGWGTAAAGSILALALGAPLLAVCSPFLVPVLAYLFHRSKFVNLDRDFMIEFCCISKSRSTLAMSS